MKKLVILPKSQIDYVQGLGKLLSDPRSKKGDFSKGLRKIIEEYKQNHPNYELSTSQDKRTKRQENKKTREWTNIGA